MAATPETHLVFHKVSTLTEESLIMIRASIAALMALGVQLALAQPLTLEVNQASQAELERLRGVGPQLSTRILSARDRGPFTDWDDLRSRVSGLGPVQAARLSSEGLTVAGAAFAATDSMVTPRRRSLASLPGL